jgi:hypothetical protein
MKLKGHTVFAVFLLLVSGYVVFSASRWSFKTGFFPLAVAIPLIVLVLLHLALELFAPPERAGGPSVEAEFATDVEPRAARRRAFGLFAWVVGFITLVFVVGFPVAVPLFLFFYLTLQSGVGLFQSTGLTACAWAFFYFVFQRLIHLQFEDGLLQRWLGL